MGLGCISERSLALRESRQCLQHVECQFQRQRQQQQRVQRESLRPDCVTYAAIRPSYKDGAPDTPNARSRNPRRQAKTIPVRWAGSIGSQFYHAMERKHESIRKRIYHRFWSAVWLHGKMPEKCNVETICKIVCVERYRKFITNGKEAKRWHMEEWRTEAHTDYIPEKAGWIKHLLQR